MPRFFISALLSAGEMPLPDAILRHIHVLRLRVEDEITLFNGEGGEWHAQLKILEKRRGIAELLEFKAIERESPLTIHLIQGISSGDRMEFTLQKGTELGITHFYPVLTSRSIVRLNTERWHKKEAHWEEVIRAACEQCGRNTLPKLHPVSDLESACQLLSAIDNKLVLSPVGEKGLNTVQAGQHFALLAGPEGGLSSDEEKLAFSMNWKPLRLGTRILRTETAALTAVAALQARWGDF